MSLLLLPLLRSPDAAAFTLVEICKICDPAMLATIPDPADKAAAEECCKCHKPCTASPNGLGLVVDPAFSQCVDKREKCPGNCDHPPLVDECKVDADCEKDNIECTAPHCNRMAIDGVCPDGTKWGGIVTKCGAETPIPGCEPKTCAEKFPGLPEAIKCCEMGFDTDKPSMRCCVSHLKNGEDPGTPARPKPCGGNETCPTCPECKPPVLDCNDPRIVINPAFKACCESVGGNLWFMMAPNNCIKSSGDCNIVANIAGDVNGQLNICCNVLNNSGTISGSTISQSCNNVNGGGPGGTGPGSGTGTPTAPASLGTCEVKCKDVDCSIAVNTGGQGVAWTVTYSPPPDVGPVASAVLKQTSGELALTPEEPAPGGSGALSIKTISDPSSLPPFTVYTPKPTSMMGNYLPKFTVQVQLNDLSDHPLATLDCGNNTALEAKGGGSGCGCFLGASPVEFGVNAVFLLSLFGGVPALLRTLRRKRE